MTVQHKSLEDEILFLLGRSSTPLDVGQLYERAELAEEIKQVSNALYRMKAAKKITRVEFESRRCYKLADGVAAPAPAGKAGRPVAAAPAEGAGLLTVGYGIPPADIPAIGDPGISLDGTAGKTQRAKPVKPKADHVAAAGKEIEPSAEDLADAILAKTKRLFAPMPIELGTTAEPVQVHIHIHIEQVDFHLGGL